MINGPIPEPGGGGHGDADLPEGAVSFDGLSLSASQKGTLWLDQVVLSNENTWDTTAPTVSLSVSGFNGTDGVS